jgi:tRNA threonylcarbamoyladenosine biosynthesis protein TsaB
MIILGIESSGVAASCAITEDQKLLGEFTLNHKLTHSEKLMPLIESLIKSLNMKASDIELISIDEGPGSYTGLRIGASIAKGMSFSKDIPIIGIPSTQCLAYNIGVKNTLIVPMIDARGDRVFYGLYKKSDEGLCVLSAPDATTIDELLNNLINKNEKCIFIGDASKKHYEKTTALLKGKAVISSYYDDVIKAYALCELGLSAYKNGTFVKSKEYIPNYLRPSQAERFLNNEKPK